MPQRKFFVVIEILVFDFELFIGGCFLSWLTGNYLLIFFPTRFHWGFGCFAVVLSTLDKYMCTVAASRLLFSGSQDRESSFGSGSSKDTLVDGAPLPRPWPELKRS